MGNPGCPLTPSLLKVGSGAVLGTPSPKARSVDLDPPLVSGRTTTTTNFLSPLQLADHQQDPSCPLSRCHLSSFLSPPWSQPALHSQVYPWERVFSFGRVPLATIHTHGYTNSGSPFPKSTHRTRDMIYWTPLWMLHLAIPRQVARSDSLCPTPILLLTCLPHDRGAQSVGDPRGHLQGHSDLVIPKERTEDRLMKIRLLTAGFFKK